MAVNEPRQSGSEDDLNAAEGEGQPSTRRQVGLLPESGWMRRNLDYLRGSVLPTLARRREQTPHGDFPVYEDIRVGEMELVWIGHASFLVRSRGFNALIDPVWAKWFGPIKRARDPGIALSDLPPIDLVLISHAHFDHLCRKTLQKLRGDHPQTVVVPEGVGGIVDRIGFDKVIELGDWDSFEFRDTRISLTPAHHWGARYLHDTHRGFGGFVLESEDHCLYHSGDSAYFEGFQEIGRKFDIETAILPIGAYETPSGRDVHMDPDQAVQAFLDLSASWFVPMHHETFPLGNEKMEEPLHRLIEKVKAANISERLLTPREGQQIVLPRGWRNPDA